MRSQMNHFNKYLLYKQRRKMENSRRWDLCRADVHKTFYAKHLRSKKYLENEKRKN